MSSISRRALANTVKAHLDGVTNATGYLGEPKNVPTVDGGYATPYWVLHPFVGTPDAEQDLADRVDALDWLFQVTVAGGFVEDVLALVDRVDARLYRWTPTLAGAVCGPCKPPAGFDPGPPRPDADFKPVRFYVPLQYATTVTTS